MSEPLDTLSESKKCPYHGGSPSRYSSITNKSSPSKGLNISRDMMTDSATFENQSLLYKAQHRQFLFTKPKIGSRADRVYAYYQNRRDWTADRYLRVS